MKDGWCVRFSKIGPGNERDSHSLDRRSLDRRSLMIGGLALLAARRTARAEEFTGRNGRPALADRRFVSAAVESAIARTAPRIGDPTLRRMFENCLPNTLDTTVFPGTRDGKPDTFVITGDIDAMWLRDSSAQLWPYLPLAKDDRPLLRLIEGAIRRQARCILIDSYANAFTRSESAPALAWALHDETKLVPGVAERKWELDSLCHVIRLAHGYWKQTGQTAPFDAEWGRAMKRVVATFREQQRKTSPGPYSFQRSSETPTDTLAMGGYGNPARSVGMVYSMFRPSDDACVYPLFVPANLFAVQALAMLAEMSDRILADPSFANECAALGAEISSALQQHAKITREGFGEIWAYEIDGYGNALAMDDANTPGLLGIAYLGGDAARGPLYQRTRSFALSPDNPYFYRGTQAEGIGGPHIGAGYIWPMSITMRALTSDDPGEIRRCLGWLRSTTAGTDFIHESFYMDDAAKFTRPWFAWANGLFGELMLKLAARQPALLEAF
jgi:meiotically up-regulated gene 157 (Mug157) protein